MRTGCLSKEKGGVSLEPSEMSDAPNQKIPYSALTQKADTFNEHGPRVRSSKIQWTQGVHSMGHIPAFDPSEKPTCNARSARNSSLTLMPHPGLRTRPSSTPY